MKKIIFSILVILMFFSKSNADGNYEKIFFDFKKLDFLVKNFNPEYIIQKKNLMTSTTEKALHFQI